MAMLRCSIGRRRLDLSLGCAGPNKTPSEGPNRAPSDQMTQPITLLCQIGALTKNAANA